MGLQAQTAEKLAEGFGSHASFEAEHKERGHKQADEPGATCLRFPQRRLRGAVSAIHGLQVAMDAAFGEPRAIRQAPDALFAMLTNRVENDNAFAPQSHSVGPCSAGWLKSWLKSALQSTRSTAGCPALRGCPSEKFMHGIRVLMAKNYIDNLGEETKKGMREKAEQGIYPSAAPLGYRNISGSQDKKTIEPDPESGPIVQKLFEWYATGNYSLKDITKKAYNEGLRSRMGVK